MEWGAVEEFSEFLPALLLKIATLVRSDVDAVEIVATEFPIESLLRRCLWRQVGYGNFVFKIGKGSPLDNCAVLYDRKKWRLRPAMGDTGLN